MAFVLAVRFSGLYPRRKCALSVAQKSLLTSSLCVALCVIPFVVCNALSDSIIIGMTARIVHLSSGVINVHTRVKTLDELFILKNDLLNESGVLSCAAELSANALVVGAGAKRGAYIRAVERDTFINNPYYKAGEESFIKVVSGALETFRGKNAIIAQKLAQDLSVKVGDSIKIITVDFSNKGKPRPKLSVYKIAAIVSSGYEELDNLWLFLPLEKSPLMESLLKNSSRAATATIALESVESDIMSPKIFSLRDTINEKYRGRARAFTWKELNAAQFENFSSTKLLLMFVMLIIVFIATIFIATSLLMLMNEKRREVAILRSAGAGGGTIVATFVITSLIISALGLFAGLPIGVIFSINIEKIIAACDMAMNFIKKIIAAMTGAPFYPSHIMDKAYYLSDINVTIKASQIIFTACAVLTFSAIMSAIASAKTKALVTNNVL